jgi:hypothetical protein
MYRHTPHSTCAKGKRVIVTLRDGRRFRDIFEDSNHAFVFLREQGRIHKENIRAFQIARD